jgi:hypothetical protein
MDFSWGGFISQGFVYTDDYNFAGHSDDGISTDFREAAVFAMWRPNARMRVGGQVTARKIGSMTESEPQFDYLSLDTNVFDNGSDTFGVRLGKLKLKHGIHNSSREVPFARNSILLPQSMYVEETRDVQMAAIGGEAYGSQYLADYRFDYSLFYGNLRHDVTTEMLFFRQNLSGSFSGAQALISNFALNSSTDKWRVETTIGQYTPSYDRGPLNELGLRNGDIDVKLIAVGGEYNLEQVSFSAEYFRHYLDYTDLGGAFEDSDIRVFEAYYAQANWRVTPTVNLLVRYDITHRDAKDPNGRKAAALMGVPAHNYWSEDLTIGAGWRFSPNWLARAELHRIHGTARVPVADNEGPKNEPHWNMVLFQLAYRF